MSANQIVVHEVLEAKVPATVIDEFQLSVNTR